MCALAVCGPALGCTPATFNAPRDGGDVVTDAGEAHADAGPAEPLGCTEVCTGDRVIASRDDLRALSSCTRITGDLVVQAPDLVDLTGLECLVTIDGDLRIDAGVEQVQAVTLASGDVAVGAVQLTSLRGLSHLTDILTVSHISLAVPFSI
jgi:hypothetical protein